MTIFDLRLAVFDASPSELVPLFFCVADAGIESTPFEREGRAIVTRGAGVGAVIAVEAAGSPAQREFSQPCFWCYTSPLLL